MKTRTGVWRIAAGTALGVGSLGQVAAQSSDFVEQALVTAKALGIKMQVVLVSQRGEFEAAADSMVRERAQAVIVQPLFAISQPAALVELLVRRKLPCVSGAQPFVTAGGLMSYGFSRADAARRTASFVERILKVPNRKACPWKSQPFTSWPST